MLSVMIARSPESYDCRIVHGLSGVDRDAWNAVANPPGEPYDPFLDWDFLEGLERTGCASPGAGWSPHHLIAYDETGAIAGAMPLYLKSHSYGEFVFDHSWADAFERAGGSYYPKLLCAVPFTPVAGRRILVRRARDSTDIFDALFKTATRLAQGNDLSSLHINFASRTQWNELAALGCLQRQDQQFHWRNDGYRTFDDFLAALSSAKRKNLRKERARAQDGVVYSHLTGDELKSSHWDDFFEFYEDTGARKWGSPYLNRAFFELLHQRMADKTLLILASDADTGETIAGALNMIGGETLYGRYWGRREDRPFLHFETCYYQAVDFAIARGLKTVEAGAQGGHKLARGYVPVPTYSAHWLVNDSFSQAVSRYLEAERREVDAHIDYLGQHSPFKKSNDGQPEKGNE